MRLSTVAEYLLRVTSGKPVSAWVLPTPSLLSEGASLTHPTPPSGTPRKQNLESVSEISSSTATDTANINTSQKGPHVRNWEIFLECSKEEPSILGASPGVMTWITNRRGMKQWKYSKLYMMFRAVSNFLWGGMRTGGDGEETDNEKYFCESGSRGSLSAKNWGSWLECN